jgi:flagellar motor switch protein FliG
MATAPLTDALAGFVADFEPGDLPPAVAARTLELVGDGSACLLAAANPDWPTGRLIAAFAREQGGAPEASVVGHGFRTGAVHAALANGTMGYACDFEPHHPEAILHPIAVMLPAALAVGERVGASGRMFLAAVALGCEVEYRVSMALGPAAQYALGVHPSAVCGGFGAAAAAAWLMGLDPDGVTRALGLAACQASGQMAWESDASENARVMGEFVDIVGDQTSVGVGADGYIRKMLTQALGEDKAGNLIDRILLGGSTSGLDSLKWMEPRAVADVIRHEHPQIQAIVVAYLDPDQSGEVLAQIDHKVRLDIVLRVSSLNTVQPAALKELNLILEKQFSGSSNTTRASLGGIKRAADIMNFLDSSTEGQLMDSIREVDEDLSSQIEDLMFVFDNLADVDDRGIQALLREVSSDVLVLALKGADEAIKEKVFKNMSKRAAELLRDDLEAKGPVRVSDVETAKKEILTIARRMAEAGEIVLGGKGGEEMV